MQFLPLPRSARCAPLVWLTAAPCLCLEGVIYRCGNAKASYSPGLQCSLFLMASQSIMSRGQADGVGHLSMRHPQFDACSAPMFAVGHIVRSPGVLPVCCLRQTRSGPDWSARGRRFPDLQALNGVFPAEDCADGVSWPMHMFMPYL
jgi:hypothetical protein